MSPPKFRNPLKRVLSGKTTSSRNSDSLSTLAEQVEKLKRAVMELTILNDLAREIGSSFDSKEIMERIVGRCLRAIAAEQGVITLLERKEKEQGKTLLRVMVSSSALRPFHMNQALLGWMCINKKPLLLNEPHKDDRLKNSVDSGSIKSLLCVPLMVKSEIIGVLTLYNKKGGELFTQEDERLLAIIAGQSAQVIENARLYEEEKALLQMQEDLKLASRIQKELLPGEPPRIEGYDLAGKSVPAKMVGGDYFDFIPVSGGRWALCLGDVSGKGLPAALLMANLQATLRSQSLAAASPAESLRNSNRLLFHSTDAEKFATVFYGILDPAGDSFHFANGGHEQPILMNSVGRLKRLSAGGLLLGAIEETDYGEDSITFKSGDVLVIYSDGVTEATNEAQMQFGEERLIEIVVNNSSRSSSALIDEIIDAVIKHTSQAERSDDITLVVARKL